METWTSITMATASKLWSICVNKYKNKIKKLTKLVSYSDYMQQSKVQTEILFFTLLITSFSEFLPECKVTT